MTNEKIFLIKFVHSILFWFMVLCLFYILYCAVASTYHWTLLAAIFVIVIEGLVIALNRGRCPLTTLAERYGAENGAVTHLFMPGWMAHNVFKFSILLFTIELFWLGIGYFA